MHGDLTINPKFQELLPPLSAEEYKQLEESILADGCRDAVLVWRNQIVDGHNRAEICAKHNESYLAKEMPFADEDEALEWILINQLGRRNLSANQKTLYIGQLFNLRKKKVGAPEGSKNAAKNNYVTVAQLNSSELVSTTEHEACERSIDRPTGNPNNGTASSSVAPDGPELAYEIEPEFRKAAEQTAEKIAEETGVSTRTVGRAAVVANAYESLPAEDKQDFAAGKITQKAVIEKAKEAAPTSVVSTKPTSDGKDDFTRIAARHGAVFLNLLRAYETALIHAGRDFKQHGHKFHVYGERLDAFKQRRLTDFLDLDTEAGMLKTLRICPKCEGKGCGRCSEHGYMYKRTRDTLLDEMGLK